ncbi:TetR/AcrR family transcriptional regulator [Streptomyces sp. NPDC001922]|uniref:TetR/AcrR family transcriptional regulator n=1 Tax=Streptomyces sp. NPDC001922 TaxID=3364624 RepID=UPI0036744BAC
MAKNRSGTGDPARTLELLWRKPGHGRAGRGPKQGLTVDAIVGTAITLADREGIDAVTMRALAQELGVTPMTLYTYVPGKAELLDLMLDTVHQRMPRPEHTATTPWRARVEAVAEANRALFRQHTWVAALNVTRPPLGPGSMDKYEHELGAFEGLGLDDVEMDASLAHLLAFVQSTARAAIDAQAVARDTALSDADWWAANAPLLGQVFDPSRYPLATRVGAAAGEAHNAPSSPEHAYAFGLARVLDGFARLIESRSG